MWPPGVRWPGPQNGRICEPFADCAAARRNFPLPTLRCSYLRGKSKNDIFRGGAQRSGPGSSTKRIRSWLRTIHPYSLCRATVYAQRRPPVVDANDLLHSRLIDEEYTRHPFYGTRRMVIFLEKVGHTVNRKRVQRLMRLMGLPGLAPGPNTSRPRPAYSTQYSYSTKCEQGQR